MLEIQQLGINEGERLRRIRLTALEEAPYAFGSTFQQAATWPIDRWIEQLQALPTFIAVLDDLDSGIVRCSPHPEKAHVTELISMWVAPTARGKGVGEALIKAVIDKARTEGYDQLLLDVSERNHFAISLYERQGFKATGVTSNFPAPRHHIKEYEMAISL